MDVALVPEGGVIASRIDFDLGATYGRIARVDAAGQLSSEIEVQVDTVYGRPLLPLDDGAFATMGRPDNHEPNVQFDIYDAANASVWAHQDEPKWGIRPENVVQLSTGERVFGVDDYKDGGWRLYVFDTQNQLVAQLGDPNSDARPFWYALGAMAADHQGRVVLALYESQTDHHVMAFGLDNTPDWMLELPEDFSSSPIALAIGASGSIYVLFRGLDGAALAKMGPEGSFAWFQILNLDAVSLALLEGRDPVIAAADGSEEAPTFLQRMNPAGEIVETIELPKYSNIVLAGGEDCRIVAGTQPGALMQLSG